jgi:hypothetical protein
MTSPISKTKIKLKNVARFQTRKSVRQLTTFHQQSTTTSPQKTTLKTHSFPKTPAKTPLHHEQKNQKTKPA